MAKKITKEENKNDLIYDGYTNEIDKQKEEINKKIISIERKLLSLNNKESIINNLILKINLDLEKTDPKKFTAIGQIRNTLNKQFEALGLITDMIIKYEDMIQKYRKMLIDIENQKVGNFTKLKVEEEALESDMSKILLQINNQINGKTDEPNVGILSDAQKELEEEGY